MSALSADHRLLLRAALADGGAARGAWQQWSGRSDFDSMDAASMQLIPLVAANLGRLGVEDPLLARMRGIHRYWWSRAQLLLQSAAAALERLARESIDAMVLDGLPLALGYYADPGLRPMSELRILVPAREAQRALAALARAGWRCDAPQTSWGVRGAFEAGAADQPPDPEPRRAKGEPCELRWHALRDCCWKQADQELWRKAVMLDVGGRPARAPDPTDLLFHTCVEGASADRLRSVRWVADATAVLRRAAPRIDWDRLLAASQRGLLSEVLRRALGQLEELAGVEIPGEVMRRLADARPGWAERWEYRSRLANPGYAQTPAGRWCERRRRQPDAPWSRRLIQLLEIAGRAGPARPLYSLVRRAALRVAPTLTRRFAHRIWGI
jgi:hypothetical protein